MEQLKKGAGRPLTTACRAPISVGCLVDFLGCDTPEEDSDSWKGKSAELHVE